MKSNTIEKKIEEFKAKFVKQSYLQSIEVINQQNPQEIINFIKSALIQIADEAKKEERVNLIKIFNDEAKDLKETKFVARVIKNYLNSELKKDGEV